jgi:hypothetical protein
LRKAAAGCGERSWCGQRERAGTSDDQYRQRDNERTIRIGEIPKRRNGRCNNEKRDNDVARDLVCKRDERGACIPRAFLGG